MLRDTNDNWLIMLIFNLDPPTIRDKRNIIRSEEGKTVYLTCNADGVPAPKVTWYYKGHEIKKTSHIRFYTHHSLK